MLTVAGMGSAIVICSANSCGQEVGHSYMQCGSCGREVGHSYMQCGSSGQEVGHSYM